jgi:hypothetical protein
MRAKGKMKTVVHARQELLTAGKEFRALLLGVFSA